MPCGRLPDVPSLAFLWGELREQIFSCSPHACNCSWRNTNSLLHWVGSWFQEHPPKPWAAASFPRLLLLQLLHPTPQCLGAKPTGVQRILNSTWPTETEPTAGKHGEEIFVSIYRNKKLKTKGTWPKTKLMFAQDSAGRNSPFILSISAAAIHLGNAKIHLEAALTSCTQLFEQWNAFFVQFSPPPEFGCPPHHQSKFTFYVLGKQQKKVLIYHFWTSCPLNLYRAGLFGTETVPGAE